MYAQLNIGKDSSSYNSLVLSNGTVSARWVDVGFGANSHSNRIDILGDSSTVFCTDGGPWRLFGMGYGNEIAIDRGADFSFAKSIDWMPETATAGSNNTFAVRNGSTFRLSNAFKFEGNKASQDVPNARIEVSDGSKFLSTGTMALASRGGSLVVTNGSTFTVPALTVGDAAHEYTGNRLVVTGKGSSLTNANSFIFVASDSLLAVEDGATFIQKGALRVGSADLATQTNRFVIGDGAELELANGAYLNFYSSDSALVVSNGTLRVGTSSYPQFNFNADADHQSNSMGTNSVLVFQGEHPALVSGGSMQMHLGGTYAGSEAPVTIRYELPPNGYEEAPVRNCIQVWASKGLRLEIGNLEQCQRTIAETKTFPLWEVTYAFQDSGFNDAVTHLNKTLPRGCKAQIEYVSGSSVKARLTLTVRPKRGLAMVVR